MYPTTAAPAVAMYVIGWLIAVLTVGCAPHTDKNAEQDQAESFSEREAEQAAERFVKGVRQPLNAIECAPGALEQVADNLEERQDREAVGEMYEWCLDTLPESRHVPVWLISITELRGDEEEFEDWNNEYLEHLAVDSRWHQLHENNSEAMEAADEWVMNQLLRLGVPYHEKALDAENEELYRRAADYYHRLVERFPDEANAFWATFHLGEIYLHELEQFEDAVVYYQRIVDHDLNDETPDGVDDEIVDDLLRAAAYAVVVAYDNLVREEHPDSVLVQMATVEGSGEEPNSSLFVESERAADGRLQLPERESQVPPQEELSELERQFIGASVQFVELYPNEDISPTVQYVAAEVYRDRGHYEACIPMYLEILESTPDDPYASFAGRSLLDVFYLKNELAKVETVARYMVEHEIFFLVSEGRPEDILNFIVDRRGGDARETAPTLDELM